MQVKDVSIKINLKVINPKTGHIGFYKGSFSTGLFLGPYFSTNRKLISIEVSKNDFLEWELAGEKEKTTIDNLVNRKK